jgi:hypothetical protein
MNLLGLLNDGFPPSFDRWTKRRPAVGLLATLVAASVIALASLSDRSGGPAGSPSPRTEAAPYGGISLQIAGNARRANAILDSWSKPVLESQYRWVSLLDYVFIVIYVLVLAVGVVGAATGLWLRRIRFGWRLGMTLSWAVVAAGAFDAIENLFLKVMIGAALAGDVVVGDVVPMGATLFALPKIVIMAAATLYILTGVAIWVWHILATRGRLGPFR